MKYLIWTSVISTVLLSACAGAPTVDYSKINVACAQDCKKDEAECQTRFADLPTLRYTHCTPELKACINACPPPGAVYEKAPANSTATAAISPDKPSIADRLKLLEELHKSGVVTDKEYADKRQEILKSL